MGLYDRVIWRGKTMDEFSVMFLTTLEMKMGRPIDYIYQGSYNKGVTNSAGTHDEGGALDFGDRDIDYVVRQMREIDGGAAWNRTGKGPWNAHGHLIIGGNERLSPAAERQWEDYKRGGDALGTYDGRGDYHWRPDVVRPFDPQKDGISEYASGDVYVEKLVKGTRDSDSVRRLQYRLHNHDRIPGRDVVIDGWYGEQCERAVQYWVRQIRGGESDGTSLGNVQANVLFGENYRVLEESEPPARRKRR